MEYRFNLTLNPNDPMHMTAIRTLNTQGRHKAQFVVNAIVHYIMTDKCVGKAEIPDTNMIEEICRKIVTEMMESTAHNPVSLIHEEETASDLTDQDIDFSSIADTLSGFRKK